jgi:hypothetical protein
MGSSGQTILLNMGIHVARLGQVLDQDLNVLCTDRAGRQSAHQAPDYGRCPAECTYLSTIRGDQ